MSGSSKAAAFFACAALAFGAAACGGDDNGDGGGGGGNAASDPAGTFASTCGNCHTLGAANTSGQVGPNLDDLGPDKATVLKAIEEGPGVMPNGLLTGADADAVATYVADNAGK